MSHVVLVGDSIFDNGLYVQGGRTVTDQVREALPPHWDVTLLAQDGSLIADVIQQLEQVPESATHLVISVGGNDILGEISVLGTRVDTVGSGIRRLADIRDRFERDYQRLATLLRSRGLPTVVSTIYDPRFADPTLLREAVAALCLFNDVILRSARRASLPVLDLRALCTSPEDFATPIEPSPTGGAKIARAIRDAVVEHDFRRRESVLLPREDACESGSLSA